ncbi:MAG: hypothetical protein M1827_003194 [Pycnora praestabilis]|nr:MAG: hypothetical protein M1827_003194 [Pycnora praestabilis]
MPRFSTIASLKIILSDIRHAAEAVLGSYPTEHISIALPNEISTFTNKNIILEAALAARVGIARRPRETEDRIHFIKHKDALQYAYDLGTCAGLGQVVGCFDKTQIAISVDYHEDSLDVMILDVTEGRCSVSGSMSSPDLGSPKHSENATLNDAQQSRYTLIWTTLDSFMKSHFAPDEDEDIPPSDPTTPIQRPRRSDIRAVVLSGDASSQGFENLRPFLQAMFSDLVGSHDEWLRESIEPSWVAAVGAAKHAKRRTQHGLPGRHDEL